MSRSTRTVIGCVWGAHRAVVEMFERGGEPAPSYEWCEEKWNTVLRKKAPAPAALPDWLRGELWSLWRQDRAMYVGRQMTFEVDA